MPAGRCVVLAAGVAAGGAGFRSDEETGREVALLVRLSLCPAVLAESRNFEAVLLAADLTPAVASVTVDSAAVMPFDAAAAAPLKAVAPAPLI